MNEEGLQRGSTEGLFKDGTRAQTRPGTDGTSRLQFHGNTQHPIFGYIGFQKSKFVLFVFLSFLVRPRPDYCSEQRTVGCDLGWCRRCLGDVWRGTRPHSTPTPACSEMPIGYSGAHTVCLQMVLNVGIISLYNVWRCVCLTSPV